ncbi:MAG: 3-phosphoshikimate 1-carboxyvinyltransferase [Gemmatirosa sp.]|nr:3-phosphoshikimate 1-carboxyvinyltransferase [Gemmatirosa sp.]
MRVSGTVRVPGDKSISHRALMFAALGDGQSRVSRILNSADVRSTAGVLRAMGVGIPELSADFVVEGRGLRGLQTPSTDLDCGNSGTTARLMSGIVAAQHFSARLVGDESLSRRPMGRVARPLAAMGASFEMSAGERLPMTVHGAELEKVEWDNANSSAQVKSAILLAGACGGVEAVVREPVPSRDHTERMLAARGAEVWVNDRTVMLWPVTSLVALDVAVPGDPSSAAFFAALAGLASEGSITLPDVCLNATRTGFFFALARMGVRLEVDDERTEGGETVGDVVAAPNALRGIVVEAAEVPAMIDELPMLACLATRADGETTVRGASELRVKESDRIAAVVSNLRAVGADADELPDGFVVRGSRTPLRGRVVTHGDHRLAMAFGVLGALPGNEIAVDDPSCVDVSYPGFWRDLAAVVA